MKFQWLIAVSLAFGSSVSAAENGQAPKRVSDPNSTANAQRMMREGQQTFRFDTFGSEAFWGGKLRLHETVATLAPSNALALGLKVDASAVPANVLQQIRQGRLDLGDAANTRALLKPTRS